MLFLRGAAGDALAFVGAQQSWGRRPGGAWEPVLGFLRNPTTIADGWNFAAFNFAIAVLLSVCAAALLVRREWALGVYTLAMTALPLSSGSLQSMGRYALVVFPLFLWLARLGRTPVADRLITAVSVTGFGFLLTLFALRVDFALS
jgi:hypothetical protein